MLISLVAILLLLLFLAIKDEWPRVGSFFLPAYIAFLISGIIGFIINVYRVPSYITAMPDPGPYFLFLFRRALAWAIIGGITIGSIFCFRFNRCKNKHRKTNANKRGSAE